MTLFCVVDPELRVCRLDTEQGLGDDVCGFVDELLHWDRLLGLVLGTGGQRTWRVGERRGGLGLCWLGLGHGVGARTRAP